MQNRSQSCESYKQCPTKTYIRAITNDLVLEFLPALHTALNEELRTQTETLGGQISEFVWVVGKTATKTTQCVGSTKDDGIADDFCCLECGIDG